MIVTRSMAREMELMRGPRRALFTECILECIFEQLVNRDDSSRAILEDVKSCRLVCHSWQKSMTRVYRTLQSPTVFEKLDIHRAERMSPATLIDVMILSDIPTTVRFNFREKSLYGFAASPLFPIFFRTFGNIMRELVLQVTPYQLNSIRSARLAKQHLPCLKTLQIEILQRFDRPVCRISPIGVLLRAAPELREFQLIHKTSNIIKVEDSLRSRTTSMACRLLPPTVNSLTIAGPVLGQKDVAQLCQHTLQLLEVCVDPAPISILSVQELLASQQNSLRRCWLHGMMAKEDEEEEMLLCLPTLDALRRLKVSGGLSILSFTFSKTLPKIEELDASGWDMNSFGQQLKESKVGSWLTKLELPSDFLRRSELVHLLPSRFPALHSLYIRVYPESREGVAAIENIYLHLAEQLKSLYVAIHACDVGDFNLDPIICGMAEGICQQLAAVPNYDDLDLDELQTRPSLRSMKGLEKLEIAVKEYPYPAHFLMTNLSAHHVFLRMDGLKELKLPRAYFAVTYLALMDDKFEKLSFG